jgi:hypothetical protein
MIAEKKGLKNFFCSLFFITSLLLPMRSNAKSRIKKKEIETVTYTISNSNQKNEKETTKSLGVKRKKKGQILGLKSLEQKDLEKNSELVIKILFLQQTIEDVILTSNFRTVLPLNGNFSSILKYRSGEYAFIPDENKSLHFQAQNGLNQEYENQKNEKVNRFGLIMTLLANFKTNHPNVIIGLYTFLFVMFICVLLYYGPVNFYSVNSCLKVKVTKPTVAKNQPAPLNKVKDTIVEPNPQANSLFLKTQQLDRYVKLHGMEEDLLKMVQEREFLLDLEKLRRTVGKDINSQQDLDFVDSTKRELYEYLKNKVRKQQPPDL